MNKNIASTRGLWLHLGYGTSCREAGFISNGTSPDANLVFRAGSGCGFSLCGANLAAGYEVTGAVRNLADGRVELTAEGQKKELEAFRDAIHDAGLAANIRQGGGDLERGQGRI